jgi:hypothetical protein
VSIKYGETYYRYDTMIRDYKHNEVRLNGIINYGDKIISMKKLRNYLFIAALRIYWDHSSCLLGIVVWIPRKTVGPLVSIGCWASN